MKAYLIHMFLVVSEENFDPNTGKHARYIDHTMPSGAKVDPSPMVEDETAYPYVVVSSDTWNALQRAIDDAGVRDQVKEALKGRPVCRVRANRVKIVEVERDDGRDLYFLAFANNGESHIIKK